MTDKKTKQTKQSNQPELDIQRVYLKDLSLETPGAPEAFTIEWQPEVRVDLNVENKKLEGSLYEVVLSVTVHAEADKKVMFLVEVHQAGIFHVENFDDEQMEHLLNAYCPTVLFPYAREIVTDMTMRASFPQLILAPVNFDAMYMQQKKEAETSVEMDDESETKH